MEVPSRETFEKLLEQVTELERQRQHTRRTMDLLWKAMDDTRNRVTRLERIDLSPNESFTGRLKRSTWLKRLLERVAELERRTLPPRDRR